MDPEIFEKEIVQMKIWIALENVCTCIHTPSLSLESRFLSHYEEVIKQRGQQQPPWGVKGKETAGSLYIWDR